MKKIICTLLVLTAGSAAIIPQTHVQPEEPVYAVKQGTVETVTEVTAEPEPLQAEAITEPEDLTRAETVTESASETVSEEKRASKNDRKPVQKEASAADQEGEPAKPEDEFVIDNSEIESCDHVYTRIHGTGGEEGDVWEYSCDKCGDVCFGPYDGTEEYDLPEE